MTWRSWWDGGQEGPTATRWNVRGWPTIYVIDHEGVIRFKQVRGEKLDAALDYIFKEADPERPLATGDD